MLSQAADLPISSQQPTSGWIRLPWEIKIKDSQGYPSWESIDIPFLKAFFKDDVPFPHMGYVI